jgi:hypothetical protein
MRARAFSTTAGLLAVLAGCGGGGSSPTAPQAVPTAAVAAQPSPSPAASPSAAPSPVAQPAADLTGSWTGGGAAGTATFTLRWALTQQGAGVTGVSSYIDATGFQSGNGRVTATVSGNTVTFSDEYPMGSLANAACAETVTGTLTLTSANRMDGTFRSVTTCGRGESGNVSLTR